MADVADRIRRNIHLSPFHLGKISRRVTFLQDHIPVVNLSTDRCLTRHCAVKRYNFNENQQRNGNEKLLGETKMK